MATKWCHRESKVYTKDTEMWLSILTRPVLNLNRNLNNNISTPCYLKKSFTVMRTDWAISRPSIWVVLFTGILCKTKFDHLCTCKCQKNVNFLCSKHLVGLVMAWVSILRKKSFSTTYKGNIACQPQQRYWSNYIYIESRITKMTIGGIFRNWMILIKTLKGNLHYSKCSSVILQSKKVKCPFFLSKSNKVHDS